METVNKPNIKKENSYDPTIIKHSKEERNVTVEKGNGNGK